MNAVFYAAAIIAVGAGVIAISRLHFIHAIILLIASFIADAIIFFVLGAPFAAALEVITYAGAIMVLFMFAIMLLNLGASAVINEKKWQPWSGWVLPGVTGFLFAALLGAALLTSPMPPGGGGVIEPVRVGAALFGPYAAGAVLSAFLLLAGLLGAHHLGRRSNRSQRNEGMKNDAPPS
jgi:NADH-quinone oxidoreductase subunit J